LAPLVSAMRERSEAFEVTVVVTGQHREMLDQALKDFRLQPDFDFQLMKPNQEIADVTANVLIRTRDFLKENPLDLVVVHGDTTTAMAVALAAFYSHVPIAHVEAGLRTHDLSAPFPEELNRQFIGRVARWHFAPTDLSKSNLVREGVDPSSIVVTGNTVVDSLQSILREQKIVEISSQIVDVELDGLLPFDWSAERFVLITGHRRENFGEGFQEICEAIRALSEKLPDVSFVYPLHLNPAVRVDVVNSIGSISNVFLVDPLNYRSFVKLLSKAYLVLTDSGGVQEEASSLGKPVLVMRDKTERVEAVDGGGSLLVGSSRLKIVDAVLRILSDPALHSAMSQKNLSFGDGNATQRILKVLADW